MRINKSHIDTIVSRALKASFDKREAAQIKEEASLAVKAYNSMFDAALRKKVSTMPKNWFRHCSCLKFTVNGQYHMLNAIEEMPTPYSGSCNNLGALTGEMADVVVAFYNSKQDLRNERAKAEIQLRSMLSNVSTFAKLLELWPEGKAFYIDLDEDAKIKGGLPAIRFDDVNAILGLKKAA